VHRIAGTLSGSRTPGAAVATSGCARCGASRTRAASTARGTGDQGLAFVCYQRSLATSFLAVQDRLRGEPLEEYTLPEGGGFYFALPSVSGLNRYLGDLLLA
jgi:deferrochelatase/peroxidase EfeB